MMDSRLIGRMLADVTDELRKAELGEVPAITIPQVAELVALHNELLRAKILITLATPPVRSPAPVKPLDLLAEDTAWTNYVNKGTRW